MTAAFYLSALVSIFCTGMVITRKHPVHALLYLVVSLMAIAMVFFSLGAEFVALLEVIVYAGAIMVLFVFMIMTLNLGPPGIEQEKKTIPKRVWFGPVILSGLLLAELVYVLSTGEATRLNVGQVITAKQVGVILLDKYYLGVEFASMLLLAGLVGAFHLGKRDLADENAGGQS